MCIVKALLGLIRCLFTVMVALLNMLPGILVWMISISFLVYESNINVSTTAVISQCLVLMAFLISCPVDYLKFFATGGILVFMTSPFAFMIGDVASGVQLISLGVALLVGGNFSYY